MLSEAASDLRVVRLRVQYLCLTLLSVVDDVLEESMGIKKLVKKIVEGPLPYPKEGETEEKTEAPKIEPSSEAEPEVEQVTGNVFKVKLDPDDDQSAALAKVLKKIAENPNMLKGMLDTKLARVAGLAEGAGLGTMAVPEQVAGKVIELMKLSSVKAIVEWMRECPGGWGPTPDMNEVPIPEGDETKKIICAFVNQVHRKMHEISEMVHLMGEEILQLEAHDDRPGVDAKRNQKSFGGCWADWAKQILVAQAATCAFEELVRENGIPGRGKVKQYAVN